MNIFLKKLLFLCSIIIAASYFNVCSAESIGSATKENNITDAGFSFQTHLLRSHEIRLDNFFGGPVHKTGHAYEVHGIIAYLGYTTLQSVQLNWQIEDGEIKSEMFENINVNPYHPYHYISSSPWVPQESGSYVLRLWFSALNGEDPEVTASDTLFRNIDVYDQLAIKELSLMESFSSINCGSCAQVAPFLKKIIDENPDQFGMIYYHPLSYEGSPLYLFNPKDQEIRKDLYQVSYTPYAVIGSTFAGGSHYVQESFMHIDHSRWAGFSLQGEWWVEDGIFHYQIEGETFIDLDQDDIDYRLLIAAVEKSVHFDQAPGSNGEKDYYFVMRFFAPDAAGMKLTAAEASEGFSFARSMSFYDELDPENMLVYAFVQEHYTNDISQAVELEFVQPEDPGDGVNIETVMSEKNAFRVFPNPAHSTLHIEARANQTVNKLMLTSMDGTRVRSLQNLHNGTMDLKGLPPGIYLLTIQYGDQYFRKKISVL